MVNVEIRDILFEHGARFGEAEVSQMRFDPEFRALCEKNTCGYYGACWTCPPDAGPLEELMTRVRGYERALVFQTIYPLEDSFDIEGMHEASLRHNRLVQAVQAAAKASGEDGLVLGAGACGACKTCTKREGKPCRFPERAVLSLEACGVDVSQLAKLAGLKYINGANTVTYFGVLLYHE
jgi:predicted metal-binding protein